MLFKIAETQFKVLSTHHGTVESHTSLHCSVIVIHYSYNYVCYSLLFYLYHDELNDALFDKFGAHTKHTKAFLTGLPTIGLPLLECQVFGRAGTSTGHHARQCHDHLVSRISPVLNSPCTCAIRERNVQ